MEIMMLKEALDSLKHRLEALSEQSVLSPDIFIATKPGPFKVSDDAIRAVRPFLTDLDYSSHTTDGRTTTACVGAIAVDTETIEVVKAVNEAKDEFSRVASIVYQSLTNQRGGELSSAGKGKAMRSLLSSSGHGRLSLRLCYRHIPVLERTPLSIRFSFSSGGRSIRRISLEKAITLLDSSSYDSYKVVVERDRLMKLPTDVKLAQVQTLAGYYKANIVFEDKGIPLTVPAFMPIFYPYDEDSRPARQSGLPGVADVQKRSPRSDRKIESLPIASSIRVHQYL